MAPAGPDGSCQIVQRRFFVESVEVFLIELRNVGERHASRIVAFDAGHMAGYEHVRAALSKAARAELEGTLVSRSFEMEALLYAAGTRQLLSAMQFGIRAGWNQAFVCICPPSEEVVALLDRFMPGLSCDQEDWDTISPEKSAYLMDLFHISSIELHVAAPSTLRDLILERVALLDVNR